MNKYDQKKLTEIYVPTSVNDAEGGSLLHRLTEKVAYKIHEDNPQNNPESNWYKAQQYFRNYLWCVWGEFIEPSVSELVKKCLKSGEDFYKRKGKESLDIEYSFAETIVDFNRKRLGLV